MSDYRTWLDDIDAAPSTLDQRTTTHDQPPATAGRGGALVVAFPARPRQCEPIVVLGAHGGSGATTLAVLLACAVSERTHVAALDGTTSGGDLWLRAPISGAAPRTWQQWLDTNPAPSLSERLTVLGRDQRLPDYRSPLAAATVAVANAGAVPIVDAGACANTHWFDQLTELDPHIVLTITARAGSANSSRPVLSALRRDLGDAFGRIHVVVTFQDHGADDHVAGALRSALEGRVASVTSLPYDVHLAAGLHIDPNAMSPANLGSGGRDRVRGCAPGSARIVNAAGAYAHPTDHPDGRRGSTESSTAGIDPPRPEELIGRRISPADGLARPPLWWVLGAHGGSGASTLAQWWTPAADAGGLWPAAPGESPYVVIAARATYTGLEKAHLLLRQYRCGLAPPQCRIVGLVVTADKPGRKPPPSIARHLARVGALAGAQWWIGYHEHVAATAAGDLPRWSPREPPPGPRPGRNPAVPPDSAAAAADIAHRIAAAERRYTPPDQEIT